ncbi:hypothetical protein HY612_02325 [Candidatus Roizmanbacteria bacterium]|nr:hypothetical protein [Candidatus Roizmanbacteria bacterium]
MSISPDATISPVPPPAEGAKPASAHVDQNKPKQDRRVLSLLKRLGTLSAANSGNRGVLRQIADKDGGRTTVATQPKTEDGDGNKQDAKDQENQTANQENGPEGAFKRINENILKLVQRIEGGIGDVEKQKKLLGNLLIAREGFYTTIVQALNPDVRVVEGKKNVYQVGETQIYGSIIAVLDATPALSIHAGLAETLRYKIPQDEDDYSIVGEKLSPRSTLESGVVFSGSSAQDRVQAYGADIDMAEYINIQANTIEEAASLLARSIQLTVKDKIEINHNGELLTLHFSEMKVGGDFPQDAFADISGRELGKDRKLRWKHAEISQGFKAYKTQGGEVKYITLESACRDPKTLKVDFLGVTSDSVVEVTKVSTVSASTEQGEGLINNSTGQSASFQEVYFDDPSRFGIVEEVNHPDKFIKYLSAMSREVTLYNRGDHLNQLKVLKRLYNLAKVQGDLLLAKEISGVFSINSAAIYQMVDRLGMANMAHLKGIDVSQQRAAMVQRMEKLLSESQHPNAADILTMLSDPTNLDIDKIRGYAMKIVNDEVGVYISDHSSIKDKINQIVGG